MRDVIMQEAQRHLRFVKSSGPNNIGGPCPFHKGGMEKRPSFYMNLNTGVFYCHTCGAKGTFIQFLQKMGAPMELIDATLEIARRQPKKPYRSPLHDGLANKTPPLRESLLGVFDYCPKSLVKAGFNKSLLKEMDIGFDKEEMRITFPLRDIEGNLVGINGRTVVDEYPRYKVYKSKDLLRFAPDDAEAIASYNSYDIKNHDYLWNAHNVYPPAFFGELGTIVIVEGYKACLWLLQNGIDNTIALQGSRMTRTQELTLERLSVTVVLFLDNNKAGKEGTFDTGQRLRRRGLETLVVNYPSWSDEQAQPDDLSPPDLHTALEGAEDWHFWRQRHEL